MSFQAWAPSDNGLASLAFLQFFLCALVAVAIPRATAVSIAILMFGSLAVILIQAVESPIKLRLTEQWLGLILLPLVVAVSSLWSENPNNALVAAAGLAFVLLACGIIFSATSRLSDLVQRRCRSGFFIGVSIAVAMSAVDLAYDQALSRWLFSTWPQLPEARTRHVVFEGGQAVYVSEATANRRAIVLTCLLPAYAYCISKAQKSWAYKLFASLGSIGFIALAVFTYSLTSQIAFFTGVTIFLIAMYLPRTARAALYLGWIAAWVLMVPIVIGLAETKLHESNLLPNSSRERIRIWSGVASEVLERPMIGHGTGTQAEYTPEEAIGQDAELKVQANHPHNGYLQVWHELGLMGVLAFAGFGFWILRVFDTLRPEIRPYFYAMFVIAAVITSTGFGLWQLWLLSAFALGTAVLRVVSCRPAAQSAGRDDRTGHGRAIRHRRGVPRRRAGLRQPQPKRSPYAHPVQCT